MAKRKTLINQTLGILIPIIAALVVGGIIIVAIGEDPITTYSVMFQKSLFSYQGIMKTLHYAAPLILTGLAIAVTFKANLFNMAVDGEAVLGGFFAGVVGFSVKGLPPVLHITLCLLAAVAVGMLFSLLPAILKAYFKVNEMVVTLMLNYVVAIIVQYLAEGIFKDPKSGYVSTYSVLPSAMFNKIFGSTLTPFFFVSIAAFVIMYFVFKRSKLGYEITAIGQNPSFAEASGMDVKKKIIIIMLISGALSGLAGGGWLLSEKYRFSLDFSGSPGLGWDGMLIALIGQNDPVGIIIAAVFYAAFKSGSDYINLYTNVPQNIVGVIQSILILFVSFRFVGQHFRIFDRVREKVSVSKALKNSAAGAKEAK